MKKILGLLLIVLLISGCSKTEGNIIKKELTKNNEGNYVINKNDVLEEGVIYTYETPTSTIEIIAIKDGDNIRLAFNTCQVCNPSPNAYFIKQGDYFVCQNCGTKIHIDRVGIVSGGCNPIPITTDNQLIKDNEIILEASFIESYIDDFEGIVKH